MKRTMPKNRRAALMERDEALTLAAWLYYERDMDQSEVARRMGLSRSQVSRLLAAARVTGVVDIRIRGRLPEAWRLSRRLEEVLGLPFVSVGISVDAENPRAVAAREAARVIEAEVGQPTTLGFGWGRTLGQIAEHVRPQRATGVELVDIVGRPIWPGEDPPFEISAALARILGATVSHVPAPAIVESSEVADALTRDPLVADVLRRAAAADMTIVALGNAEPATSSLVLSGAITTETVQALRGAGAVGEIIGHFYDEMGDLVESELDARIVGLGLEALKGSRRVVAVAGGADKVGPIAGAARGRLIHGLVTDAETASTLLEATS